MLTLLAVAFLFAGPQLGPVRQPAQTPDPKMTFLSMEFTLPSTQTVHVTTSSEENKGIRSITMTFDGVMITCLAQEKSAGYSLVSLIEEEKGTARNINQKHVDLAGQKAVWVEANDTILVYFDRQGSIYRFALMDRRPTGAVDAFNKLLSTLKFPS